MVDEQEESYEAHEEGEYHFSDDQINYELEPDNTKTAAAVPTASKESIFAKLGQSRRMVLGAVAFLFLIFIVYKMLTPSSPTLATEFSQDAVSKPVTNSPIKPTKPLVPEVPTAAPSSAPMAQTPPSSPPVQPAQQSSLPAIQPPSVQNNTAPPTQPMPPQQMTQQTAPVAAPATPQQQPVVVMPEAPATPPPLTNSEMNEAQTKMIMDRLAALEEQNAKLVSLLQTQVAQRMSEEQAQNVATQQKVHTLSKRLSNMEGSINKIAQIMQDEGFAKSMPLAVGNSGLPSARASQPKVIYTVQAIIPGRAWLKSDAGDTVTVAEGDLLKDYGKITKIDPYDGIVEIDTGTKTITLSYGSGGD